MIQRNFFNSKLNRSSIEREKILDSNNNLNLERTDYMSFGKDYFDNSELGIGYGGYEYDGRYEKPVKDIINFFNLQKGHKVLEVGCAKGFILKEFKDLGIDVCGTDISEYAINNAHPTVKKNIIKTDSTKLPFDDKYFDFVYSKEVLPHIEKENLVKVISECKRVSKGNIFFEIQTISEESQRKKMFNWDMTHKIVETSNWWIQFLEDCQFRGYVHFKSLF